MGLRALAASFILLALASCDTAPPKAPAAPAKFRILGTVYPLAQIAAEVGGALVQVEWIIEQGQSLEELEPTVPVLDRVGKAGMVITNGAGEEWAAAGFDDPMRANSVVRLDVLESARVHPGARQLWLDPAIAKETAAAIAQRLGVRQPAQAAFYRENSERFCAKVDKLMSEFAPKIAAAKGRKMLVLSNDYSPLLSRLEFLEVRPVNAMAMRLSDADLAALRNAVRDESPAALLLEVSTPRTIQEDLSKRLGIPVITLDSLGTSALGRNDWEAILRYDLEQLTSAPATKSPN